MNAWRSHAMHTSWKTGLEEFNRLVLKHQDEAFCLAFYMLGDQAQAGQVVQSAVRHAYNNFRGKKPDFRTQILQLVCEGCLKAQGQTAGIRAQLAPLQKQMDDIPGTERLAIILIDMLELSYAQAGLILRQSPVQLRRLLTQGRLKLRNEIPPA